MQVFLLRWKGHITYIGRFLLFVWNNYWNHEGVKVAAYLTFTSLFAVVPVMTVTYAILALIPDLKSMGGEMQDYMFQHFMPTTSSALKEYLQNFADQASNLTTIGVGMLFVTSILMLRKIEEAFNLIWHVKEARKGVQGFFLYWGILSIGPILMGMAFAITSYIASWEVLNELGIVEGTGKYFLRGLPLLLSAAAFALAYIAIPNTKVSIRYGLVGGVVAATLFETARHMMATFVTFFPTYQLVYGVFSAVPLFLIWVFVSWSILLLGAEFVQGLSSYPSALKYSRSTLGNALAILKVLFDRHQQGGTLSEEELLKLLPNLSGESWEWYYQMLNKQRLVTMHSDDGILLARDLHTYSFADLYCSLFPNAFELDLQGSDLWQKEALSLFDEGVSHLQHAWRVPLATLFAEPRVVEVPLAESQIAKN